jgi:hypothetical protein
VCNVNALCANYNADRYLSGSLESLDADAMEELGDSAIPSLVRVATSIDPLKDPKLKKEIDTILHDRIDEIHSEGSSVFSFSIPKARAKSALKVYAPNRFPESFE